jgi:hypothetical protein
MPSSSTKLTFLLSSTGNFLLDLTIIFRPHLTEKNLTGINKYYRFENHRRADSECSDYQDDARSVCSSTRSSAMRRAQSVDYDLGRKRETEQASIRSNKGAASTHKLT